MLIYNTVLSVLDRLTCLHCIHCFIGASAMVQWGKGKLFPFAWVVLQSVPLWRDQRVSSVLSQLQMWLATSHKHPEDALCCLRKRGWDPVYCWVPHPTPSCPPQGHPLPLPWNALHPILSLPSSDLLRQPRSDGVEISLWETITAYLEEGTNMLWGMIATFQGQHKRLMAA